MKSFFLPIGRAAGASLPTFVSALSCGAAIPVTGLDILHISDAETDPVLPFLIRDLDQIHAALSTADNHSFFPSSFRFNSCCLNLPSARELSDSPFSEALLNAVRGKGMPLSYKTDHEAVDWAVSVLLSRKLPDSLLPFGSWAERIADTRLMNESFRVVLLCDLCDPFSAGTAFALLRYLKNTVQLPSSALALYCFTHESRTVQNTVYLSEVLASLDSQGLVGKPDCSGDPCADSIWLLSLPSSLISSDESYRLLYAVTARLASSFFTTDTLPSPGLHTVSIPGILTFHALNRQAVPFSAFLHSAVWLLSDLLPALDLYLSHPGGLRSFAANTRNGLFKRLFRSQATDIQDRLATLNRALRAVLSEILALIRFMPDPLRLAEVSTPLWQQTVDACGRTVTVASEYDVSVMESEESGIMSIKPVHRVSMADTEEEKQQNRIEKIADQLDREIEQRNKLFATVGGSWACMALQDCCSRCVDALGRAEETLNQLKADTNTEHLSIVAQSRRIRLLNAAISRCRQDLSDRELFLSLSEADQQPYESLSPYSSQFLSQEAASALSSLIRTDQDSSEPFCKTLKSMLPDLFYDLHLSDEKILFRRLLSVCVPDEHLDPLLNLFIGISTVSLEELSSVRFLSAGNLPPVLLLPDLYPVDNPVTVSALLPLLPDCAKSRQSEAETRGLLAMLMLRQYRRRTSEEATLYTDRYTTGDSSLIQVFLSANRADEVWIFSLGTEEKRLPFALIIPGRIPVAARLSSAHASLIPAFASPWFDTDALVFRDPCSLLSEGDRDILAELLEKITDYSGSLCCDQLKTFLASFRHDLLLQDTSTALPDQLELRLKAAFGLRLLPAFKDSLLQQICYYEHFLSSDTVSSAILGTNSFQPSACNVPDDIIYLYRNIPFARENSKTLLDTIPLPAEKWIMSLLEQESRMLFQASDDYHDALVSELNQLLKRYPGAMPDAREIASDLLEKAKEPVTDTETELIWPWDPKSPSVLTILSESLGSNLAVSATQPFSDLLSLFPARGNEIIGDSLLAAMCLLAPAPVSQIEESGDEIPAVMPDAVLPPLSADFCFALCSTPEGRTLFRQDLLTFERTESNSIRVSLNLTGSFPVHLHREYSNEEILHLYAHDIPTLAVWPNLPFPHEDWHAYFTYAHLPSSFHITIYSDNDTIRLQDSDDSRSVFRSSSFPLSFSFHRDNQCMGSLPNILPVPELAKTDQVTACIDFGSVGTSVIFAVGHQRKPLRGNTLVRTLLNNPASSRDLLRREFLPAVPVSALLPTATRIFRNVPGRAPMPFEDGIVLMSADLQDVLSIPSGALYTCLKWEEEKGRSVTLCLHQIMLMTALQARVDGAVSLSWRFALPDEMAKAGRERLLELFSTLAAKVNDESGFPSSEKESIITFAPESSALGAYFRLCASEDTRGGFMVMDIGACTADISLFLRGREQAVRTCQIPLGVHYMLLPSLLRNPSILAADLGHIQDPVLMQEITLLGKILENARADTSALRHSRLALDNFLADRYLTLLPDLLQNQFTGAPTYIGSLLLLYFSYLMMLSGLILLQIAADPGRNDFLPEQLSLCLAGRGSILLESLPVPYKTAFWHFLTMFRNRRVASLSMLFSSEKKMEIPVGLSVLQEVSSGLPPASAVPAAISVRPEELLPQFILRFATEFPASAEILFQGFFTGDFYHPFTPYGESMISEAISQSFTEQTTLRPYDALSAWIGSLLDLLSDSAF